MSFTTDWFSHNIPNITEILAKTGYLRHPNLNILEIGSWEGRSTCWFLDNLPESQITCVDTWEGSVEHHEAEYAPLLSGLRERFKRNVVDRYPPERVHVRQGDSKSVVRTLSAHAYDIVYVDGSHEADDALVDLVQSFQCLKPGGLMIVDDYEDKARGVKVACNAFVFTMNFDKQQLEVIATGYQMYMR